MIEKISYEQVMATSASLSASSKKMREILSEVEQKMQRVNTEDTWKSAAAEELYAKFASLESSMNTLNSQMNYLINSMSS